MNDYKELVKSLTEQIKREPNNSYIINDLAISLMEINQFEAAFFQFMKAAKINPNIQTLCNLAYFYYTEGEPLEDGCWRYKEKEAVDILEKVIRQDPKTDIPYTLLGEIYLKSNRYDKAVEILSKAIDIKPTIENLNNLGVCYFNKTNFEQASKYFCAAAKLIKAENNDSLYPLLNYGISLAILNKKEEALKIATELVNLNRALDEDLATEITEIYYILGEYSHFANLYSKLDLLFYSVEWIPTYLYSLHKLARRDEIDIILKLITDNNEQKIQEALQDEDDEEDWGEPGRKEEYIEELKNEIIFLKNALNQILKGNKPKLKYELSIETGCYLFGCKKHNNPNYIVNRS
jgi:Flp pilus assembly protein TadD